MSSLLFNHNKGTWRNVILENLHPSLPEDVRLASEVKGNPRTSPTLSKESRPYKLKQVFSSEFDCNDHLPRQRSLEVRSSCWRAQTSSVFCSIEVKTRTLRTKPPVLTFSAQPPLKIQREFSNEVAPPSHFPNPHLPICGNPENIFSPQYSTCLNLQVFICISVRFPEASRNVSLTDGFSLTGARDPHFQDLVPNLRSGVQLSHSLGALKCNCNIGINTKGFPCILGFRGKKPQSYASSILELRGRNG